MHDVGGMDFGPIDRSEHDLALWEIRTDAILRLLSSPAKRVHVVDVMRRTIEDYGEQAYDETTYFEKWIRAARNICLEQGLIGRDELDAKLEVVRAAFAAEGRAVSPGSVPYDRTEQP